MSISLEAARLDLPDTPHTSTVTTERAVEPTANFELDEMVEIRRDTAATLPNRARLLRHLWKAEKLAIGLYNAIVGEYRLTPAAPLEATRLWHRLAGHPRCSMRGLVAPDVDGVTVTLSESATGKLRLTEIRAEGVHAPRNADLLLYRALRVRLIPNGIRSAMRSDHALEEAVEELFADMAVLNLKKRTWLIGGGETP